MAKERKINILEDPWAVIAPIALIGLPIALIATGGKTYDWRRGKFRSLEKYFTPAQIRRGKQIVREFYKDKGCTVRFVREGQYERAIPSCPR
jgi:hypothetical protein